VVDPAASAPAALPAGGSAPREPPYGNAGADAHSGRRFLAVRTAIVGDETVSAAERRSALVELSDAWLTTLFDSLPPAVTTGMSLVAVGGYGRRELLPCSDLDVLLLHRDRGDVAAVADGVFYPVWDSGISLDHAVRTVAEARAVAADDLAVALGLVDARHVAGDPDVTESLRAGVLGDWRRQAALRLPKLAQSGRDRQREVGELAHLLEPDLKQAYGGLRDIVALRAVAASWVADRPHAAAVSEAHEWLLVVRDALHRTTGRRTDRLVFEDQDAVAALLGLVDADALMRRVAEAGRAIAYATEVTWRHVDRTLRGRSGAARARRPVSRRSLVPGVVEHDGEAVLARDARPATDPVLPLRAAAGAAQAGLVLSPATVERLALECPPLPAVWPDAARDALVSLLGAGRAAVPVWDSLEATGLVLRWLPEWEPVRYRPQRTPVHRHTVDRHLVETAVVAAGLTRRVSRPDLLLLAALFHDLGKGGLGDHSETGAAIAIDLGARLGLSLVDAERLGLLVRHHLLLPAMATRRDLDDPTTIEAVVRAVGSVEVLDLLAALTEADATAAGPVAWSPMRAKLVADLVQRTRLVLGGKRFRKPPTLEPGQEQLARSAVLAVQVDDSDEPGGSCRVTVVVPGRSDALAPVAGVLALHRLDVRAATIQAAADRAVQVWHAATGFRGPPDTDVLRTDIARALDGGIDITAKLRARAGERRSRVPMFADPHVEVLPGASAEATVIEVRAHDEPGLLYRLVSAIGATGTEIRSAVVGTLGAEAVDVFYLVDPDRKQLPEDMAARVLGAITAALG
jgi:[protein-PII] uridylyltransferase